MFKSPTKRFICSFCVLGTSSGAPKTTEEIVSAMKLDEAHDILAAMKRMIEEDGGDRAKMILDSHPQLIPALIQIQNRLGMAVPQHLLDSSMAPPDAASIPSSREDGSNFMVHQVSIWVKNFIPNANVTFA